MSLTEFLLARIAEDEAVAIATQGSHDPLSWSPSDYDDTEAWGMAGPLDGPSGYSSIVVDPARVLAECEAKRRIVEGSTRGDVGTYADMGYLDGLREAVAILALPYAAHPDYDEAWRQL